MIKSERHCLSHKCTKCCKNLEVHKWWQLGLFISIPIILGIIFILLSVFVENRNSEESFCYKQTQVGEVVKKTFVNCEF